MARPHLGHLVLPLLAICSPAQENRLRIVAFGDSTTATRSTIEQVWAQRLPELLASRGIAAEVRNAGVGGDTTRRAARRLKADVLDRKADIVVVQFGLNDSAVDLPLGKTRVPKAEYAQHLRDFIAAIKKSGGKVLLMTPNACTWTDRLRARYGKPPFNPKDRWGMNFHNQHYAQAARDVATGTKTPLIDLYAAFRAHEEKTGGNTDDWLLDGVHPNDVGHASIALLIADRICNDAPPESLPAAYTIPTIDLAQETQRQIIVDREKGQYLGHPTTVLLEDGRTMIAVYPKGHGKGAIIMKRSDDAGLTWSRRLPTPANWASSKEVPTIHRVIDAKGTRRLILFSGLHPIRMAVSEDDGRSWSALQPIGDFGGIVTMGCVERLRNGDHMALFHDDGRFLRRGGSRTKPVIFRVFKTLSQDGGLTWSQPVLTVSRPPAQLCEPGLIRSPDGRQLCVLMRENSRRFNSFVTFSDDEGGSWSPPRQVPAALTGDRHIGRYAKDGRLFITFRDTTRKSPTKGDWVAWVGTYEDIVKGREGQYRVRLMDNHRSGDCAYPGLEHLRDDTFVTTTYGHWTKGESPYIVSVRLKLAELDARARTQRKKR